jgi:hypothetical protein
VGTPTTLTSGFGVSRPGGRGATTTDAWAIAAAPLLSVTRKPTG